MTAGINAGVGVEFGPTAKEKFYISVFYHRGGGGANKTIWAVKPPEEYSIFCDSDSGDWRDGDGHYWGIRADGNNILGTKGERLCKFPCPSNANDKWHGYPVSPLDNGEDDAPPEPLVQQWVGQAVISETTARRIRKCKI